MAKGVRTINPNKINTQIDLDLLENETENEEDEIYNAVKYNRRIKKKSKKSTATGDKCTTKNSRTNSSVNFLNQETNLDELARSRQMQSTEKRSNKFFQLIKSRLRNQF